MEEIKQKPIEAVNYNITLTHIKGYRGSTGNETAEKLAKSGAKQGEEIEVLVTKDFIKQHLKNKLQ